MLAPSPPLGENLFIPESIIAIVFAVFTVAVIWAEATGRASTTLHTDRYIKLASGHNIA